MTKETIVVTGATGNIGNLLSQLLLEKGKKVRVVGRKSERLRELANKGAEPFTGTLSNASFLTRVFKGADAVFAMIPPNFTSENPRAFQNLVSDSFIDAIRSAGVASAVTLSSVGAHLPEGTGPIAGLYDNEQKFNSLEGLNVVHLRPAFFMENFFFNIDLIKSADIAGFALMPDLVMPMIATKDIAVKAFKLLDALNFTGKAVKELLGQRDASVSEAVKILGSAIGKPDLQYVQFPYEEARQALIKEGTSPQVADSLIEMDRGLNEGYIKPTENRTAENTTPTSLEEFAQIFAAVFRGSAAAVYPSN